MAHASKGTGVGARLMNRFKGLLAEEGAPRIVTFADELAVPFFQKHGFRECREQDFDFDLHSIGQYNGAVLHECVLIAGLPYARLPHVIRASREALLRSWLLPEDVSSPPPPTWLEQRTNALMATISCGKAKDAARALGVSFVDLSAGGDHGMGAGCRLQPWQLGQESLQLQTKREALAASLQANREPPQGPGSPAIAPPQSALSWVGERVLCHYYSDVSAAAVVQHPQAPCRWCSFLSPSITALEHPVLCRRPQPS